MKRKLAQPGSRGLAEPRAAGLAEEHRRLQGRIEAVREAVLSGFRWDDARLVLADLRDTLDGHFALEEEGGYLSEVLSIAPHHGRAVARLASEHDRLRTRLALLVAEALMARSRESLRENVADFLARLAEHERRENEIVQVTFSTDVPAVD